ncbi:hypothetical protein [Niallia sp. Krafla_26]|uniref:hypothetical protein n=1 Tax=Niallia sp. Krafla_26 TaxID=3064703 RepID=UPI003D17F38D
MKKYIVFLPSFAVFYGLFQIVSGLVLTALHTPNLMVMNPALSNEVTFGQTGALPLITLLFVATMAYFFTEQVTRMKLKRVFIKK